MGTLDADTGKPVVLILTFGILGLITLLVLDNVLPSLALILGRDGEQGRGLRHKMGQRDIKFSSPDNEGPVSLVGQAPVCLIGPTGALGTAARPLKRSSLDLRPIQSVFLPDQLCGLISLCPASPVTCHSLKFLS